jgi:hypothetical protein
MRVMIVSQPKAGTYLTSALLAEMGLEQTWLHINQNGYQKYNPDDLEAGRKRPEDFTTLSPLAESLELVPEGGFAVTHLPCLDPFIKPMEGFKKVLLTRDIEECRESTMRFMKKRGRESNFFDADHHCWIRKWDAQPDVFRMEFDDLIGKDTQVIDRLQYFLFRERRWPSCQILQAALDTETLTLNR